MNSDQRRVKAIELTLTPEQVHPTYPLVLGCPKILGPSFELSHKTYLREVMIENTPKRQNQF
jgi:hypothetical protein